ncbi:MAG: fused MFS/spermidine synthase [Bacteroidia bacterium]|nr:fused MFS/spermidine synthase [Bacteroidia bacterium]MBL4715926.1 fused MFS/spermidine synthase [Bacteroidia bacterium]
MKKKIPLIKVPIWVYYIVAVVEGGCLMTVELSTAKIIEPVYGNTLLVWASVLGVTLAGLAFGYFVGGRLIDKLRLNKILFIILMNASLLMVVMLACAQHFLKTPNFDNIGFSVFISALIIIFPSVLFMGMVGPILVQMITRKIKESGKITGRVYAISTLSGIAMTFFLGFFLLPEIGITKTITGAACLLGLIPLVTLVIRKRMLLWTGLFLVAFTLVSFHNLSDDHINRKDFSITYQSESLFGQVKVIDETQTVMYTSGGSNQVQIRKLFLNGTGQTCALKNQPDYSLWPYVHRINVLSSIKPPGSKALIIGFGGGSVASELIKQGFKVDGLDIDGRMFEIARDYFSFDLTVLDNQYVDDARHFINITDEKYDIIIIDILNGEIHPFQIFTIECFTKIGKMLNQDGIVIINYQSNLYDQEKSLGARSIYKTIQATGFNIRHWFFMESQRNFGDLIMLCSKEQIDYSKLSPNRLRKCCRDLINLNQLFTEERIILDDAIVLYDNYPMLDILSRPITEIWRKESNRAIMNQYQNYDIPLFN